MTNFQWWQSQANKAGLVMCVLCFESKNPSLMHRRDHDTIEDVCQDCWEHEQMELDRRRELEAQYGI